MFQEPLTDTGAGPNKVKPALFALILVAFVGLSGCTYTFEWIQRARAQRAVMTQDYRTAVKIYSDLMTAKPDDQKALIAARAGAKVAHFDAKEYLAAVEFYKHIILKSPNVEERKAAQRYIAQIYFENLQDFNQAVLEYERLLKLDLTPQERFRFRLNLARSHFQLNNLDQTLHELNVLIDQKPGEDEVFDAQILKANVLVSSKKLVEAAESFETILKDFPERSKKDNVGMNLVVVYEELKNFGSAIAVLERMRPDYPNPDFLDLRIERLKERKENLPGAQGWKR